MAFKSSEDPAIVLVFGFLAGLALFAFGLKRLQLKQRVENTPTSKIRSIAMGPVEVNGRVVPSDQGTMEAPFTGSPCVYYRYAVEEYRRSGKNSQWVMVDSGQDARGFFVEDDTGRVLVDSKGAEVDIPAGFKLSGTQAPPERVQAFLQKKDLSFKGWFFNKDMRYTEYHLAPGVSVFVTGEAGDNPFVAEGTSVEGYKDVVISKGASGPYYISDKSEKRVVSDLGWQGWGLVLAGLSLGFGSLAFLLMQWKIF